ncbi:MAG: hypothetical protein OEZ13_12365 [Spirochaetia bacterium]|nr:hypothetical protein [Spirochaetia bacterium]
MKCKKQPPRAKLEIKNVWEVHLDMSIWKKIKIAAQIHSKTYSWIVRYCVFQLTNKKNLFWNNEMLEFNNSISKGKDNKHRLYTGMMKCY